MRWHRELAVLEERVDLVGRDLDVRGARRRVDALRRDALVLVRLRLHAERVGADAEVRVHRHEDRRRGAVRVADLEGGLEDRRVHRLLVDRGRELGEARRDLDRERAAGLDRDAFRERATLVAEIVEEPYDMARVTAALRPLAFELVDLFDDVDRNDDVVVVEAKNRVGVMKQDVRVEDVVLLHPVVIA